MVSPVLKGNRIAPYDPMMPDPKSLRIGDLVRFVSLPEEWADPRWSVPAESLALMKKMIQRTWPSRVYEVDQQGQPWIRARIRVGKLYHDHTWAITEQSGLRRVNRRT